MSRTTSPLQELIADEFDLSGPLTLTDRALLLRRAIDYIADLSEVRRQLEASLAADMESDQLPVEGVGVLVRSRGGRRTQWDGEALRSRIVKKFADGWDPETGEALDNASLAARVAEVLAECGGLNRPSHQWKVGELKRHAVKYGDCNTYIEGVPTVRFA